MKDRIVCIDGWRAIAALGVLYTHTWAALNFPKGGLFGIDIFKMLNILGQGVHLFFVISGFCFYWVMNNKRQFSFKNAVDFWKKRWKRIAPAFYVAAAFVLFINFNQFKIHFPLNYLANLLFVQPYIEGAEISGIYWSLSVEWIFYLVLPFIFYLTKFYSELKLFCALLISCCLFNLLHYSHFLMPNSKIWYYGFLANYGHFAWGLLLGYAHKQQLIRQIPYPKCLFIGGLLIAYVGKWLFTAPTLQAVGQYASVLASIAPFIMTFGFAWMIYVSLNAEGIGRIIGNPLFSWLGRISYSFYLWHAVVLDFVLLIGRNYWKSTPSHLVYVFLITLLFLLPLSKLNYHLLESFYFTDVKKKA